MTSLGQANRREERLKEVLGSKAFRQLYRENETPEVRAERLQALADLRAGSEPSAGRSRWLTPPRAWLAAAAALLLVALIAPWNGAGGTDWPSVRLEVERVGAARSQDPGAIPQYSFNVVLHGTGEQAQSLNAYVFLVRFADGAVAVERLFPIRASRWDPELLAGWQQNPIRLAPGEEIAITPPGQEWRYAGPEGMLVLTAVNAASDALSDAAIDAARTRLEAHFSTLSPTQLKAWEPQNVPDLSLSIIAADLVSRE